MQIDLNNSENKIALLIDADNISVKYADCIFDELNKYGDIVIRRVYGDWTKLRDLLNLPTTEDYAKRSADANERTANAVEALAGQKTEGGAESETGAGNTETTGGDSKESEITTPHEKPITIGENQVKLFNDAVKESLKPIFNFSDEEFLQMNLNAISSSFMNEDEKTRYTKMIMKEKKLN